MTPILTAFERSPDRGRGLARDMRVRWALEEVGQPYDVRLFRSRDEGTRALGASSVRQIRPTRKAISPVRDRGDRLHIAERHAGLLPDERMRRARAIAWMFAALNTVEPPIVEYSMATILERDKSWYAARLPMLEDRIRVRLGQLSDRLGEADWLDGGFQRRRPADGDGAAPARWIGPGREISEPRRLRRTRRGAARLPAGVRRSAGGFHQRAHSVG
jgi:glutathione S-transferase